MSFPTRAEFNRAVTAVREELHAANVAYMNVYTRRSEVSPSDIYAACERAQQAAFELKQLFTVDMSRIPPEKLATSEKEDK